MPRRGAAFAVTLTLALAGASWAAAPAPSTSDDPLQSDECRRAVDDLQAREATSSERATAAGHAQRTPGAPLEGARRRAALACLANRPDPVARPRPQAPPSRLAQPPVAVPPLSLAPPPATAIAHPTPLTPIVPATPQAGSRPQFITSCDAGGCWANDGTRLNRVGPNLSAGSRGLCVQQGNVLTCP